MVLNDEYRAVVLRLQLLIAELDRLQLATVAVHADLALRRLEDIVAGQTILDSDLDGN